MKKICKPKTSKYRGNREKSQRPEAKCTTSSALFTDAAAAGLGITVLNVLMLSWPVPESICIPYRRTKRIYAMLYYAYVDKVSTLFSSLKSLFSFSQALNL